MAALVGSRASELYCKRLSAGTGTFSVPRYLNINNPKKYLIEQLSALRDAKNGTGNPPSLFTEENAESIFNMLDPCEKASISLDKYCHALETMGLTKYDKSPPGAEKDNVKKEDYLKEA
ncbi:unnamed protein product [Echinostoma caproni]|uniref:EF-hand domain-containing protein n=1 Tax=Echinostoma caproni TaxID=27848 RepID=A0A183AXJ9_9TREM|nr:unnamed protein product [Echinostoma caproni]